MSFSLPHAPTLCLVQSPVPWWGTHVHNRTCACGARRPMMTPCHGSNPSDSGTRFAICSRVPRKRRRRGEPGIGNALGRPGIWRNTVQICGNNRNTVLGGVRECGLGKRTTLVWLGSFGDSCSLAALHLSPPLYLLSSLSVRQPFLPFLPFPPALLFPLPASHIPLLTSLHTVAPLPPHSRASPPVRRTGRIGAKCVVRHPPRLPRSFVDSRHLRHLRPQMG